MRLRFAEVDNVNIFHAGVDNVSIDVVPEPSTWVAGIALLGFAAARFRRIEFNVESLEWRLGEQLREALPAFQLPPGGMR